jgi:hypothetical protein
MAFAPACVVDAVGLDQPAVHRSLLVGVAGGREVREEVRSAGESLAVEPGIELVQDLLPGVQALGVYPGLGSPRWPNGSPRRQGPDPGVRAHRPPHQRERAHVLENDERCAHNVCVE